MYEIKNIRLEKLAIPVGGTESSDSHVHKRLSNEGEPLRWAVVKAQKLPDGRPIVDVETTIIKGDKNSKPKFPDTLENPIKLDLNRPIFVHIVPTGIQAAVGGSLGDAMPANLALSKLGLVVTHPNTCNGGILNVLDPNSIWYVEGYGLDLWSKNNIYLAQPLQNNIGVIVDCGERDEWVLDKVWNGVWGFMAHAGAHVVGVEETRRPVGGKARRNQSGAFVGEIKNLDTVFEAAEKLIQRGANVLAVFTFIEIGQTHWNQYFKDKCPNPVGGTEAIISHSLVRRFGIPTAHAPLLRRSEERALQNYGRVRPAAGLEAADPFYIFSVLLGLQYAPRFLGPYYVENRDQMLDWSSKEYMLEFEDISAVVCPASAMGGIPMMRADALNKAVIGVRQSETVLTVRANLLGFKNAIEVENYLEAVGLLSLAKTQGNDYSPKRLREFAKVHAGSLRHYGEEHCHAYGINPATLLRPLVAPE